MHRLCGQCRFPLAADDVFCGNCGARTGVVPDAAPLARAGAQTVLEPAAQPRPAPAAQPRFTPAAQPRPAPEPQPRPAPAAQPQRARAAQQRGPAVGAEAGQFFGHAAPRPPGPLSNATRYLCAAAYLDPSFANRVIGELTASHRAVVPSRGIDLVPIIRHCLNARKMQLIRDALLLVLLLVALGLATLPAILILVIAFFFGGGQRAGEVRGASFAKMLAGLVVAVIVVVVVFAFLAVKYLNLSSRSVPFLGPLATGGVVIVVILAYVGLLAAVLLTYSYKRNQTLAERLSPGAEPPRFPRQQERIEGRIAEVGAAQHGNVTLFDGQNPFLGTGSNPFMWNDARERERAWSIAIELDRAQGASNGWGDDDGDGYAPIDPVELHSVLRERLLRLRDPDLPDNERISALSVDDHVVAEGLRRWDSPLIDPARKIPYSLASPEAIDALIRHSQANVRYYQRVSVSDEGQAVWSGRQEVLGGADQELIVSAFIYVAVEGRMFYLEFVPAVLSPVLLRYHAPDWLPKLTSGKFFARAAKDAASTALADIVLAPFRLFGAVRTMIAEGKSFSDEVASAEEYVFADVGAHISVRELGATIAPRTYIQRLDAAKYTQIIERLVTETVLDFLVANGVDTAAYRASAQMVINNSVSVTDSPGAAISTGAGTAKGHHQ